MNQVKKLLRGGRVFLENGTWESCGVLLEEGRIAGLLRQTDCPGSY